MISVLAVLKRKFLTNGGYARLYLVCSGIPALVHGREVEFFKFLTRAFKLKCCSIWFSSASRTENLHMFRMLSFNLWLKQGNQSKCELYIRHSSKKLSNIHLKSCYISLHSCFDPVEDFKLSFTHASTNKFKLMCVYKIHNSMFTLQVWQFNGLFQCLRML